jgi:uncharacterized protein
MLNNYFMEDIMISKNRRDRIKELLTTSKETIKGQSLAEMFNVTRQVIVKDIAIIRAEGLNIIATPEGYMVPSDNNLKIKRVIAVMHSRSDMGDELKSIIKYGCTIEDVIVEHPLYGEIKAMLMIKNLFDLEKFEEKFNNYGAEPLSALTNGIHLHTISCDNEVVMDKVLVELDKKGYLIQEKDKE